MEISVRFWNVYGPQKYGERSHVITDFIHKLRTTGLITMMTSGEEKRQFLHTEDCAVFGNDRHALRRDATHGRRHEFRVDDRQGAG